MSKMREFEETAMAWLVRRDHPDFTPQQQVELEAWVAENVMHRVAFMRACDAWKRTVRFKQMRPVNGDVDVDLLLDHVHYPRSVIPPRPYEPPERKRRWNPKNVVRPALFAALAAGICACCTIGWYAADQLRWEHYSTGIGGKEEIPLPDGTHVTLNTSSDLRVRMTRTTRELRLVRGEAVIGAARDDKRPFRLQAGHTTIQTASADFDVRMRDAGDVDVVVSAGRVAAEIEEGYFRNPFSSVPAAQSVISGGYMASISRHDIRAAFLDSGEGARKIAWLTNTISFRGGTLTEWAAEFNRYNRRKIVVLDSAIANRRMGGVFQETDLDSFVAALHLITGAKATTVGGEVGPGYGTIRLSSAQARR